MRATQRLEPERLTLQVAPVRLGAWGSAEDLTRLDSGVASEPGRDETDAALAAFGPVRKQ